MTTEQLVTTVTRTVEHVPQATTIPDTPPTLSDPRSTSVERVTPVVHQTAAAVEQPTPVNTAIERPTPIEQTAVDVHPTPVSDTLVVNEPRSVVHREPPVETEAQYDTHLATAHSASSEIEASERTDASASATYDSSSARDTTDTHTTPESDSVPDAATASSHAPSVPSADTSHLDTAGPTHVASLGPANTHPEQGDSEPATTDIPSAPAPAAADRAPAAASFRHSPITTTYPSRPDYAWLTSYLQGRIESLKTYPRLAQRQGWEGRVVVRATIAGDGRLLDAVVTESSGYASLDEDALTLMRRSCPLHLQQQIHEAHVVVTVPIHYRLR
ncbi:MAG: TonB family protein [Nitrospiraceae bacterium]